MSKPTVHYTEDIERTRHDEARAARKAYKQAINAGAGRRRDKLLVKCAEHAVEYGTLTLIGRACVGLVDDGHLSIDMRRQFFERARERFMQGKLDYVFMGAADDAHAADKGL